jgi:endogenous inhibitor of DNA gyrase (YacG/DUF329 family)
VSWATRHAPDPGESWDGPEPTHVRCDECNTEVALGDVLHAAEGCFCSETCQQKYERDLCDYLARQGHMEWDHAHRD